MVVIYHMKHLHWFILLFLFIVKQSQAQNIVPNPGFEDHTNCPTSFGQIGCPLVTPPFLPTVKNWISAVPNSPDYFNGCTSDIYASVPDNFYGHHPAHGGKAYTGIIAYSANSINPSAPYMEYIEIKLDKTMQAGEQYQLSCFVKPVFNRDPSSIVNMVAVKSISALFTSNWQLKNSPPILSGNAVTMQSRTGDFIKDTVNWTEVTGYYTATGGEEWLTIGGSFNTTAQVSQLFPDMPRPSHSFLGYYLIDDVSVTPVLPCDTAIRKHDTLICELLSTPVILQSSGTVAYSYQWNTGDAGMTLDINKGGTYWCFADLKGCNVTIDTFNVSIFRDTTITSVESVSCDSIKVLEGKANASQYLWSTGETTPSITINDFGAYTCMSVVNCSLYIDHYNFGRRAPYQEDGISLGNDTSICSDELVSIGHDYDFAVTYLWNTGDTTCCITPRETGVYTLSVSDPCYTYMDSIQLDITRCSDCIFVPNAFTPNKDGVNDGFGVRSLCAIDHFAMRIYNRWGQVMFSTNDINARWNGFYIADFAASGTYYYYIEYNTLQNPAIQQLKGDLLLLR